MLNKKVTYRAILYVVSACFFLWALFRASQVAMIHVAQTGTTYHYLINVDDVLALNLMLQQGILWYVAVGVLLLGVGLQRVKALYWSLQIVLWLAGITVWYQTPVAHNPLPENLFWIIVTAICSLILLALQKRVLFVLAKLLQPLITNPNVVKDARMHEKFPLQ